MSASPSKKNPAKAGFFTSKLFAALVLFVLLLLGFGLRLHLGDEILFLLLDAGADLQSRETQHPGLGTLQQLLDRELVVLDEGLAEQRDLSQPFVHAAFDDLHEDGLGLALVLLVVLQHLDAD